MISFIVCLLLGLASGEATPLEAAKASIRAADLLERAGVLASDQMAGRNAGLAGADRAALYLADSFASLGLEARGQDGTYFDPFSFRLRSETADGHTQNVVALWRG